jgi:hypothetical protein
MKTVVVGACMKTGRPGARYSGEKIEQGRVFSYSCACFLPALDGAPQLWMQSGIPVPFAQATTAQEY